jgi:hypothetical protein
MWVPSASRPAGQAPGENVLQATLVDAQFGAIVDAGSIPAASTWKAPAKAGVFLCLNVVRAPSQGTGTAIVQPHRRSRV